MPFNATLQMYQYGDVCFSYAMDLAAVNPGLPAVAEPSMAQRPALCPRVLMLAAHEHGDQSDTLSIHIEKE